MSEFKVGQKVIAIKNGIDYGLTSGHNYAKGDIGVIKAASHRSLDITFNNGKFIKKCSGSKFKEYIGFGKSDLKTGMLVKTNDGVWYIIMKGIEYGCCFQNIALNLSNACYFRLDSHKDDLTHDDNLTINLVAEIDYIGDAFRAFKSGKSIESISSFKIIWRRKSTEEIQLEKVIDDLRVKLTDTQRQLAALKGN